MSGSKPPSGGRRSSGKGAPTSQGAPSGVRSTSGTKFYNGPTIPIEVKEKAEEIKDKATNLTHKAGHVATQGGAVAKNQARKAISTARRHPWSIISIISTLPFLLLLSLTSTIICPPPKQHSPISKFVLSSLGLHSKSAYGPLREKFCYPANVYHDSVLVPYVYPQIENVQHTIVTHPIYTHHVLPTYTSANQVTRKIWNGPVKPVVNRVRRGAKRFYLTFVQPHLPWARQKVYLAFSPLTSRIEAAHKSYVSPHLSTAQRYANDASGRSYQLYQSVAGHPLTKQSAGYAATARDMAYKNYMVVRPHLIRAAKETRRVVLQVVLPRILKGLEITSGQIYRQSTIIRIKSGKFYAAYLEPHVGPYVDKVSLASKPYTDAFYVKIYKPFVKPILVAILPEVVMAPEPKKSFWAMIADILPEVGSSSVGEGKAAMKETYDRAEKVEAPKKVKESASSVKSKEKASASSIQQKAKESEKGKLSKTEIQKSAEVIKKRVDQAGQEGYDKLSSQLLDSHTKIVAEKMPLHAQNARQELDRFIDRVITGFNKFWTDPKKFTPELVDKMSRDAESRVAGEVRRVKAGLGDRRKFIEKEDQKLIDSASKGVDEAMGKEFEALLVQMSSVEGATTKDWSKLNAVKSAAETWKDKYHALATAKSPLKALNHQSASVDQGFALIHTELDDMFEGYKARTGILRRSALDQYEAAQELASASSSSSGSKPSSTGNGRYSILPVAEAVGIAAAGEAVIGKGKEQIMDAFNQASAALAGQESSTGIVDQAKSLGEQVISSASASVHSATRSAMSAVGVTPSPESPREHLESVVEAASNSVYSVYSAVEDQASSLSSAASDAIHQGTRSVISAVGGTPTPEGAAEHLASIGNVVAQGAAQVYGVVEENVHHATRSAMSAVGATPSPETPQEHFESIVDGASSLAGNAAASASSVIHDASSAVHDATRAGMRAIGVTPSPDSPKEHLESIANDASSLLHDATRSLVKAVGATPSPESPGEHLESVLDAAGSVYSNVDSKASSLYTEVSSTASSAVSEMTNQAALLASQIQSLVGLAPTPTPLASSASAYVGSLYLAGSTAGAELLAEGSSLLVSLQSEASKSIHSATRAASRAVGATPSPEGVKEHLESVSSKVESVARSVIGHEEL